MELTTHQAWESGSGSGLGFSVVFGFGTSLVICLATSELGPWCQCDGGDERFGAVLTGQAVVGRWHRRFQALCPLGQAHPLPTPKWLGAGG